MMSTSPIFVATFVDEVCTRMSINCTPGDLDLERGKRLARYAYESRMGKPAASFTKAHFEDTNGQVLMAYSAIELNDDANEPAPEPDAPAPTSNEILTPDLPPLKPAYRRVKRQKRPQKSKDD
jgi:hypothetical protein